MRPSDNPSARTNTARMVAHPARKRRRKFESPCSAAPPRLAVFCFGFFRRFCYRNSLRIRNGGQLHPAQILLSRGGLNMLHYDKGSREWGRRLSPRHEKILSSTHICTSTGTVVYILLVCVRIRPVLIRHLTESDTVPISHLRTRPHPMKLMS